METIPLFQLNPAIDRTRAAGEFAADGVVQIRDFLTPAAAQTIHRVLSRETPWGLALIAVAFPLVWFLAWIFINALAWWRDITAGER